MMVLCHHFQNLRALRRCWWRWKIHRRHGWQNSLMFFCCFLKWPKLVCWFFLLCKLSDGLHMTTGEMFVEHVLFRFRSDSHIFAWQSALKTIAFLLGIWKIKPPATWEVLFGPRPVEKDMSVAKLIERILEVGSFFLRILLGDLVTQVIWGHCGLGSFYNYIYMYGFFFFPQLSRIFGQHLNCTELHSTWSTLLFNQWIMMEELGPMVGYPWDV